MEKERMLVTQALNELKLIDSRIKRAINNANFVAAAKTAETKVTPNMTKDEYRESAKSSYQSILALIDRRSAIKTAIVASNAVTEVTINEDVMTVADAIEMKNSIEYEEGLLITMRNQLNKATGNMNTQNITLESRINGLIEQMLGKDAKSSQEDLDGITIPMRNANEYSLVDPLKLDEKIKELSDRIDGFKSTVDSALQISNCTTWIEF